MKLKNLGFSSFMCRSHDSELGHDKVGIRVLDLEFLGPKYYYRSLGVDFVLVYYHLPCTICVYP